MNLQSQIKRDHVYMLQKKEECTPTKAKVVHTKERRNVNDCKTTGITVQILLFISNGAIWVISILAIIGGFIIGLNTKTIDIRLEFLDLIVTTPATVFITYGLIIVVTSIFGCFTATGGNKFMTFTYIVLLILVLIFDTLLGVGAFYSKNYMDYIMDIKSSMDYYGKKNTGKTVGIFKLDPTVYWDHIQSKGQCCGMNFFMDWKNTSLGKRKKSVPDTCCNFEYDYQDCGSHIFRHPDNEHHEAQDIIYTRGCLKIFPAPLVTSFEETVFVGLILGCVIIFCLLLAIVLFILVITKKYIPREGPEYGRPVNLIRARRDPESKGEKERGQPSRDKEKKKKKMGRNNGKIAPVQQQPTSSGPAGGDQRRTKLNEKERKVSFKQTTLFIPNENRPQPPLIHKTHEAKVLYHTHGKRRNSD